MAHPEQFGRFLLEGEIGRGGMGVVYRARDEEHGRRVALKTLLPDAQEPTARKRFRREADVLARLDHPNVCRVFELGEWQGQAFISMELLEGESLAQRLRRGAIPVREAVQITHSVLSALDAVHQQRIVHRDVKPSNVLLTPLGVKVVDFGLAKRVASGSAETTVSQVTQTGAMLGTPHYMSPEQIHDGSIDERSDLFSVAAMLFEMVAGRRAFAGQRPMEVTHSILYGRPPALGGSPGVAVADRVIRRALEKKPSARYASAAEMSAALEEVLRICGVGDTPTSFAVTRLIVLPFRLMPPDPEKQFLAFGVPDGITNALSSLDSVVVRSPTVAAKFADGTPDFKALAREADVDVVLMGSMLSAGERLRVDTQLVRVPEGTVEWSHKAELRGADVIDLLDKIVERVVESLALSLTTREHRMLKRELPGNPVAFECVVRANLAMGAHYSRTRDQLELGTQLLGKAVEEDPEYPDAWARLARCHWVRAKSGEREVNRARARECLARAFELAPELPLAYQVAAFAEIETGEARKAMARLVQRLSSGGAHPELYAALVQASRYAGLLEVSAAAHERLRQLDRNMQSTGMHAYWRLGHHEKAMAEVREPLYYDAYHLGVVQGDVEGAISLLREREPIAVPFIRPLLTATRALLEGDEATCIERAEGVIGDFADPEAAFHMVRHIAYFGHAERVVEVLGQVLEGGYNWFRTARAPDPWLEKLFRDPAYLAVEELAKADYLAARSEFYAAGGRELLGVSLPEDGVPTGRP